MLILLYEILLYESFNFIYMQNILFSYNCSEIFYCFHALDNIRPRKIIFKNVPNLIMKLRKSIFLSLMIYLIFPFSLSLCLPLSPHSTHT